MVQPAAIKGALRLIGTILVALRAVPQLGPWAELCSTVGVALLMYAQNGPGAVAATDYAAIMNAASKVTPEGVELRIRKTPIPPPPAAKDPTVIIEKR